MGLKSNLREGFGRITGQITTADLVRSSGLVDEAWYRSTYGDLDAGADAVQDYVINGVSRGRNPNPAVRDRLVSRPIPGRPAGGNQSARPLPDGRRRRRPRPRSGLLHLLLRRDQSRGRGRGRQSAVPLHRVRARRGAPPFARSRGAARRIRGGRHGAAQRRRRRRHRPRAFSAAAAPPEVRSLSRIAVAAAPSGAADRGAGPR